MNWKAGGFPIYEDGDGKFHVCLFVSNDTEYGGLRPQMAKGHPDSDESSLEASVREVSEETGINPKHLALSATLVGVFEFTGQVSLYNQHCYYFKVNKKHKTKVNSEGYGKWFKIEDGIEHIRLDQRVFLERTLYNLSL